MIPAQTQEGDEIGSRGQLRSTAHSLIETLQVQLERERQQKHKLLEHLQKIEELSNRQWSGWVRISTAYTSTDDING